MKKIEFKEEAHHVFYNQYFDKEDFISYKYDVGAVATRKAIFATVTHKYGKVLEIGTGISSLLLGFNNPKAFDLVGIDISENTIAKVSQLFKELGTKAEFFVGNAEQLPFKDNEFDIIVSSHTFEHIKNDLAAFKECSRILKKGGELVLFVPGRIDGTATEDEWKTLGHYRSYNLKRIKDLEAGNNNQLRLETIKYVHKVHNAIWNRLKSVFRWVNYPIKKWILRDKLSYEARPMYQKYMLPALGKTLDFFDSFVVNKEKNFLGSEFNVLVRFIKA